MPSPLPAPFHRGLPCVQLRVATPWSFHRGASRVEDLARAAARRGIQVLAMADRQGLWGAVPFQRACEAEGVQPVHGLELRAGGATALLLARDEAGWASLCRASTAVQLQDLDGLHGGIASSRVLTDLLLETEGCFLLPFDAEVLRALLRERGPEDLAVPVPPGSSGLRALALAGELGLPAAAAPPVVAAEPADLERHRLLVAIGERTVRSRLGELPPGRRPEGPGAWLRGPAEQARDYAWAPEALEGAARLARACSFRIPLDRKRLPRFPVPGGRSASVWLARLCERGLRRRRVPRDDPRYRSQLRRELRQIEEQGFADYFLIVADIVRYAREQGIQNCGRGSAANSLVAWLLGLTQVDPLRHGLYFERFMNSGRTDCPDVDLDFAWDERDRILDYVYERYGRERVAMISTHQTFAARGAVRELALALGVPPAEIGPVTRALPGHGRGALDPAALRRHPQARRLDLASEPWRTIFREAALLDGLPRHLGVHPGGVVIAPSPLTDHLPLQRAAKETGSGRVVLTQWDMGPVEEAGLVKIDLLGNRGLAVIRDCVREVERHTGLRLDLERVDPVADTRTRMLLERGDTMGCFYIESPSMRSLLRKLRCRSFEVLVAASSIIRPGISSSGMMQAYIERYHEVRRTGRHDESWYLLPELRELLGETFGVMAYQEDVLKIAERVAGMTAAEADGLRRAMTKKRSWQHIETYRLRFLEGARRRGAPEEAARELWRQIESFSGYSFCKAHSASYAEVSCRSAFLRAHHPAEFLAAVLRNQGGYYSTFAYLSEARRMGLRLELPDLNRAGEDFEGAAGTVRVGLGRIRGLSLSWVRRLLRERERGGPFASVEDLVGRLPLPAAVLETLARAGALDRLPDGLNRAERLRQAALYARRRADPRTAPGSLFAEAALPPRRPPPAPEFPRERLLHLEMETLGFLVSAHPLELFRDAIHRSGAVPARELRRHVDRPVRLVGWQVTQKPIRTRKGDPMGFLSFEDTTALYEAVLFPRAWRRLAPWLLTAGPYLLEGVPREEHGVVTVEVQDLRLLERKEPAVRA